LAEGNKQIRKGVISILMIIADTAILMTSDHRLEKKDSVAETLRVWIDPPAAGSATDSVTISAQAKGVSLSGPEELVSGNPKLLLIKSLIEAMTGHKIRLLTSADLNTVPREDIAASRQTGNGSSPGTGRAGWGVSYDYSESHTETENTSFQAAGMVKTADGKEMQFALDVRMARSFSSSTSVSLRAGDALLDPLVVNFNGPAAMLTDQEFFFDLDADGTAEKMPFVQGGSGVLAFDRNGDRRVNDGSELFGPATGNGFAELARYDADGNGWIDEKDGAYQQLGIWTKAPDGADIFTGLKASGVGAIFTGYADTSFALKDDVNNNIRGQIRRTGLYLNETGAAGTIQQLDVAV
jgi:hypothetical protein